MRSFVWEIFVIELFFARGFPLEEASIVVIHKGALFGVNMELF
jgi:hypothetical protein